MKKTKATLKLIQLAITAFHNKKSNKVHRWSVSNKFNNPLVLLKWMQNNKKHQILVFQCNKTKYSQRLTIKIKMCFNRYKKKQRKMKSSKYSLQMMKSANLKLFHTNLKALGNAKSIKQSMVSKLLNTSIRSSMQLPKSSMIWFFLTLKCQSLTGLKHANKLLTCLTSIVYLEKINITSNMNKKVVPIRQTQ